ncbi:MAG: heme exporter ATP-binding protein CcmA [Pseudomonadota bacterium]|jgi:heme exporter protein A
MQACRLALSDLSCRRGDRVLFRGLNCALSSGDALHVAGSNGIGKSSLIRIAAGLLPAYAGTVFSQGTIALLDERPALDPHQPLDQALAFWAALDGVDHASRDRIATQLGLLELRDVPFRYLSTGQRKRAALARLLGQRAEIWLLDEPLNGLDTAAVKMVEGLIAAHCQAGGIALVASHQPIALPGSRRIDLAGYQA